MNFVLVLITVIFYLLNAILVLSYNSSFISLFISLFILHFISLYVILYQIDKWLVNRYPINLNFNYILLYQIDKWSVNRYNTIIERGDIHEFTNFA